MKKFVSKTIATGSAFIASGAFFINQALAQGSSFFDNPQTGASPNVATQGTLGQNVTNIINFFLGLLGLIAVAFLIYAGVLMVTAGGNDDQVGKAKKIITFSVIGIIIILLSYTIVTFVTSALG